MAVGAHAMLIQIYLRDVHSETAMRPKYKIDIVQRRDGVTLK